MRKRKSETPSRLYEKAEIDKEEIEGINKRLCDIQRNNFSKGVCGRDR